MEKKIHTLYFIIILLLFFLVDKNVIAQSSQKPILKSIEITRSIPILKSEYPTIKIESDSLVTGTSIFCEPTSFRCICICIKKEEKSKIIKQPGDITIFDILRRF